MAASLRSLTTSSCSGTRRCRGRFARLWPWSRLEEASTTGGPTTSTSPRAASGSRSESTELLPRGRRSTAGELGGGDERGASENEQASGSPGRTGGPRTPGPGAGVSSPPPALRDQQAAHVLRKRRGNDHGDRRSRGANASPAQRDLHPRECRPFADHRLEGGRRERGEAAGGQGACARIVLLPRPLRR